MKKNTIKQTIIAGFISILGVVLFLAGYIFTDVSSRANSLEREPQKTKVTFIKNVPTGKKLTNLATIPEKKQTEAKALALNVATDTTAPSISAPEETVIQNTQVNIYEEITATDDHDGDITEKVVADRDLDTTVIGQQLIHFTVTDASGNTGSTDRTFNIIASNEPVEEAPIAQSTQEEVSPTVTEPTADKAIDAPVIPTEPAYGPMTLTMNGQTIPYQNGGQGAGQSIIDSNPGGIASTWGGAAVQSGDDGQNTHFIGHNPGVFSTVFSLGVGSQIVVTDANGTPTTYTVQTLLQLDDYGTEVGTGTNYWDLTVGTAGGERITLQSCVNDDINLFAIAYK
ncbi:hypothetical protein UAY_02486 [Enterococcus moraviensis ATCC BAA-383]|uniref:Pesticidal crystal protein Cry22Aa Ig-like domain-containing protein n=1 Tax=Enterococcus moraviensis ATCC BAA-383 TaxID=1158609 RepID=R2SQ16_9ENTE|nr:immunoglobulin-like domain-containing protein [Enterococcus moraviensis]EOH97330.1 hypothetical protein UAY_02486 [Enterococcus moraviensis ATCC BAA-383]EOT71610.1 hypothetical protein I586_01417 [Enterococcus moraviensis ATCC BAA-383]OJG66681.1 hypothetical protein RV09_GL000828 [Enterococcus moraviensis]